MEKSLHPLSRNLSILLSHGFWIELPKSLPAVSVLRIHETGARPGQRCLQVRCLSQTTRSFSFLHPTKTTDRETQRIKQSDSPRPPSVFPRSHFPQRLPPPPSFSSPPLSKPETQSPDSYRPSMPSTSTCPGLDLPTASTSRLRPTAAHSTPPPASRSPARPGDPKDRRSGTLVSGSGGG